MAHPARRRPVSPQGDFLPTSGNRVPAVWQKQVSARRSIGNGDRTALRWRVTVRTSSLST